MVYQIRGAEEADRDFLFDLHVAALKEYVTATWGWDETWQYSYFHNNFRPEKVQIVMVDGKDVGAISVEERDGRLHLDLIELLPDRQGQGIGTALITEFVSRAHAKGLVATLEVLRVNKPAQRLYERLGFRETGRDKYKVDMANPPAE